MSKWLYQLSATIWQPENYRLEVWEGKDTYWDVGRIYPAGSFPNPGDSIVLVYAKTGSPEPGIYGIGVVTSYNSDSKRMTFRVTPPSDYVKINPIWDNDVENAMNRIRPNPMGTMWEMDNTDWQELNRKVRP